MKTLVALLAAVLGPLFARIPVAPATLETLRALGARGQVVFVLRTANTVAAAFARWLARHICLPRSDVVFLKRPGPLGTLASARDPFPELLAAQRATPAPVFLVPLLLVTSRRARHLKPGWLDAVLGSVEAPGLVASLLSFLRGPRNAVPHVGQAVDLTGFLADRPDGDDARLARTLRGALYYHLTRELRAILGPPFKSAARLRAEVLADPSLRRVLESAARDGESSEYALAREARRHLRQIAAHMVPAIFEPLRPIVGWILRRLYDEIAVDEAGFAALRAASERGPIVLCPSHKSHVDYVVLTYLFYTRGLLPPHVAAGANLAFWPFGPFARWCGGFFIRRSFKGDRVYTAVLRAYIKRLLRDRFPQEFFIEGGRSRTGKLLPPKTGLLSMEVDAWLDGAADDVLFVPVAIDYERLAEAASHARELAGAEKPREDLRALFGARKALQIRHGRLFVRFGEVVSLRRVAAERSFTGGAEEAIHRAFVTHLANQIAYGIASASTLTPVALVASVMLTARAALRPPEILTRTALLHRIARDGGPAPSNEAIFGALEHMERDGWVRASGIGDGRTLVAVADRRALLDYHRAGALHWLVAPALLAVAKVADGRVGPDAARHRALWLSRLLKLEFTYRVGVGFDRIYDETHALLDRPGVAGAGDLTWIGALVRPTLEAYGVAAGAIAQGGTAAATLDQARRAAAAAKILPEAVNKATLENAFRWLESEGLAGDTARAGALAAEIERVVAALSGTGVS